MKTYRITIKDPMVQRWFDYLFDKAELSTTIEWFAAEYMNKLSSVEVNMQDPKKEKWTTKYFLKSPTDRTLDIYELNKR